MPWPYAVRVRRTLALLVACVSLLGSACQGPPSPPTEFVRARRRAARTRVECERGLVVAEAVPIERRAVPRAALVTIDAVLPPLANMPPAPASLPALEQVWRDGRLLYLARTHYPPPTGVRTVLVDRDGRVVERTHEVPAGADVAKARAAAHAALAEDPARLEVVQGDDGEWLRAHDRGGARSVDCDANGVVRSTRTVEWRNRAATPPR